METFLNKLSNPGKAEFNKRHWLVVGFITMLFVLTVVMVFGTRYEVNDDAIISNIAAGAYGEGRQYLVYINVVLGFLFKPFYIVFPFLNWFVVFQFAIGIFCYSFLGKILIQRFGYFQGIVFQLLLLLFTGMDFFTRVHYVKTASILLSCGFIVIIRHLGYWNKATCVGCFMVLLGSMLRFQQFYAIGGMSAALLLYNFIKLNRERRIKAAATVIGLVLLCLGTMGIHTATYNLDKEWVTYNQFNEIRTEISDFKMQFATPELLAELGYSDVDFAMIDSWNLYDPEVYSQDNMQLLEEHLPGNSIIQAAKQTVYLGIRMLYTTPTHILFSFILLVWLLFSSKKNWPALVGTLTMLGLMVFYLSWRGRYPDRIDYTLVFSAIVLVGCCFKDMKPVPNNGVILVAAVMVIGMLPNLLATFETTRQYWADHLWRAEEFDIIAEDKEHLYIADVDLVDAANGYFVWQTRPEGYFSNVVFSGSWLMYSPFQQKVLANHHIINPFKDSINNEQVLIADRYSREVKELFFQQHYSSTIQLVPVGEQDSFTLYSVVDTER